MSSIESSKTLGIIGTLLLVIGLFIPWGGAVLEIIGIILFMMAIKNFSTLYNDPAMYQNALTGIIYYIIAAIAVGVGLGFLVVAGIGSIFLLGLGIIAAIIALIAAFIFFVLAASRLRRTFNDLAQRTGEQSFHTAGTLLWWGAILTIVFFFGLILIFIAWIFALNRLPIDENPRSAAISASATRRPSNRSTRNKVLPQLRPTRRRQRHLLPTLRKTASPSLTFPFLFSCNCICCNHKSLST